MADAPHDEPESGAAGAPLTFAVPEGPIPPQAILPLARAITDGLVAAAVADVRRRGLAISCRAACGACCRQLVMITETEARALGDLVAEMPEPRRRVIEARFADAVGRAEGAGLAVDVLRPDVAADARYLDVALAWFRLGVPCPFLEAESCSIHPDRPLACREYLVTSPPEECARVWEGRIDGVDVPQGVSAVLATIPASAQPHRAALVPLVFALEWTRRHVHRPFYDARALFERFLREIGKPDEGDAAARPAGGEPQGA